MKTKTITRLKYAMVLSVAAIFCLAAGLDLEAGTATKGRVGRRVQNTTRTRQQVSRPRQSTRSSRAYGAPNAVADTGRNVPGVWRAEYPPIRQETIRTVGETPRPLGRPSGWVADLKELNEPEVYAEQKEDCPPDSKKDGNCGKNMLVYFTAPWCGYCKTQEKYVDQLKKDGYIVYKINVDPKNKGKILNGFAKSHGVTMLPTILIREKCKTTQRFQGIRGYKALVKHLKKKVDQPDPKKPEPKPVKPADYDPLLDSNPLVVDYSNL